MRFRLPKPPSGTSEEASAIRQILQFLKALTPIRSSRGRTSYTTRGALKSIDDVKVSTVETPTSGLRWRGGWSDSEDYEENDVVFLNRTGGGRDVSGGPYLGLFVCTSDVSAGEENLKNVELFPGDPGAEPVHWQMMAAQSWDGMNFESELGTLGLSGSGLRFDFGSNFIVEIPGSGLALDLGPNHFKLRTISIPGPDGSHYEFEALANPVRTYSPDGTQVG